MSALETPATKLNVELTLVEIHALLTFLNDRKRQYVCDVFGRRVITLLETKLETAEKDIMSKIKEEVEKEIKG